jgi:hypothetical protein
MRRTLRLGTIACISEKLGLEFAGMDGRQLKLRVLHLQTRESACGLDDVIAQARLTPAFGST